MSAIPDFDFRLANPLICNPQDGPGRFAVDTLHRAASTLQLFSSLIGGSHDGIDEVFADEDRTFAFCLQLDGIALTLRAVADGLNLRSPTKRSNEVIIEFSEMELDKLTILACRAGKSVCEIIQEIVADSLRQFSPDNRKDKN